jgi:hypothetical protein
MRENLSSISNTTYYLLQSWRKLMNRVCPNVRHENISLWSSSWRLKFIHSQFPLPMALTRDFGRLPASNDIPDESLNFMVTQCLCVVYCQECPREYQSETRCILSFIWFLYIFSQINIIIYKSLFYLLFNLLCFLDSIRHSRHVTSFWSKPPNIAVTIVLLPFGPINGLLMLG